MPLSAQQLAAQKNLSYVLAEKLAQRILKGEYEPGTVELQTPIRTTTHFMRSACSREVASLCMRHCSTCVALVVRAMMT